MLKVTAVLVLASLIALPATAQAAHHTTLKLNGVCSAGASFGASMVVDPLPAPGTLAFKFLVKKARPDAPVQCGYICIDPGGNFLGDNVGCPSTDGKGSLSFKTTIPAPAGPCPFLFPLLAIDAGTPSEERCFTQLP